MKLSQKRSGDMFGGHAKLYAEARPTYPAELFEYLAGLCSSTESVWDCATGTGQSALPLASYFSEVNATDINKDQIKTASPLDNISYSVQSAESTDFEASTFDLICVAQALHWFEHDKFWQEVNRVLKPGGVFAAWGYDWTKTDFATDNVIKKYVIEPLEEYWNPKAKILWGGYSADVVRFPYQEIKTPSFFIELNWNLEQLFQYFLSWSSTQSYIKDYGMNMIDTAKDKMSTVWGNPAQTKLIQWPIHMLVGIKK